MIGAAAVTTAFVRTPKALLCVIRPAPMRQSPTGLAKCTIQGEVLFDDVGSCVDCPPEPPSPSICAVFSSSDVSPSSSLTAFSSATMSRILASSSNVICEDSTSLVSCIRHTHQRGDKRSCPTTVPRFPYGWNFEPAPRCCWF